MVLTQTVDVNVTDNDHFVVFFVKDSVGNNICIVSDIHKRYTPHNCSS